MKKIILLILLFNLWQLGNAQERGVTGVVTDAQSGVPLSGVSVYLQGTTDGTFTDAEGQYRLDIPKKKGTLLFSFLGYTSATAEITSDPLNISLNPTNTALDEVLVVAYGTAKKASYTGSISTIDSKAVGKESVSSISRVLQGNVPGVQSVASAGQPGSDATIRIRGVGSINASSDPLYVVDGVPYTGSINAINPADVESISVLKDAASSSLYGSRGANGVVIITTKQGKLNAKPIVTINAQFGTSSRAVKDYSKVNSGQYFELTWEAMRNKQLDLGQTEEAAAQYATNNVVDALKINPFGPEYPNPVGLDGQLLPGAVPLWDGDWTKSTQQTGLRQEVNLGIRGGGEFSKYYVSAGYLKDKGFIIGSGFTNYTARLNYTTKVNNWLETGFNLAAGSSSQEAPTQTDIKTNNYANFGRLLSSIYPVYVRNPDGSLQLDENGDKVFDFGNYRPSAAATGNNLLGSSALDQFNTKQDNLTFRAHTQITVVKGLKIKSSINADYTNSNIFTYRNPAFGGGISTKGSVEKGSSRNFAYTYNNFLDYTFEKNKSRINVLAGQEVYVLNFSDLSGSRTNFGFLGVTQPDAASLITGFSGGEDNYKLSSLLSKVDYSFDERYFLSGSFRRDGSSRFSPTARWGNFWSVGLGWNLSEERFLQNREWLNFLKLRLSYGAQGNDNLGSYYQYQALYSIYNSLNDAGLVSSTLPTPDLKWETNLNLNVGLDYSLFKDRLSGSVEYYIRRSKDLLFQLPMAPSLGFNSINSNTGALKNEGIDFSLQWIPLSRKNFEWTIGLNASHYKNVVTALPVPSLIVPNTTIVGTSKQLMVGKSINEFFIREWAGVDETSGSPLWYKNVYDKDENGKEVVTGRTTTTVFADADLYYEGSSLPDLIGGISNEFRFKQFSLSFLFAYSIGGKILDFDLMRLETNGNNPGRALSKDLLNRWTPENTKTEVPRLTTDETNWNNTSTRFLFDATYARLKNLNLGYTLPDAIRESLHVQDLNVFIRGENLLTFYGHKGMDPEQAVDGGTFYRYPAQKTISLGFNLSF